MRPSGPCTKRASQEGCGAESDGFAGRTLGQLRDGRGDGKKVCEGTCVFFLGQLKKGAQSCLPRREFKRTLLKSLVFFWKYPPSPQQAVAFLTGNRLGEQMFDIGSSLWQPLWGYIRSGKPNRLLWTSFYGQHLRGWFSTWNASQFLVLPYKLMSAKPVAVCKCFGGWKGEKCRELPRPREDNINVILLCVYIRIYIHAYCGICIILFSPGVSTRKFRAIDRVASQLSWCYVWSYTYRSLNFTNFSQYFICTEWLRTFK